MFGEMVGACLADCWKRAGAPADAIYAELGPGRGTLASDALRILASSGFAGEVHLVETSPVLRKLQQKALPGAHWHESIDDLPARPLLLVANEFLDALPIRQHVGRHRKAGRGRRRRPRVRSRRRDRRDFAGARRSGGRDRDLPRAKGGVALFIDYGHERSAPGDTLQAVRGHRFAPVLDKPGEQDLTAHVDFEAVARVGARRRRSGDAARASGRMAASAGDRSSRPGTLARQSRASA